MTSPLAREKHPLIRMPYSDFVQRPLRGLTVRNKHLPDICRVFFLCCESALAAMAELRF